MRVALYLRVSTRDKGQDTDNQRINLVKFCELSGHQIVAEYEDKESGGTGDRAKLKEMLSDASKRKFDLLMFWSLDRLSREGVLRTLNYLEMLTSYGVGYKSYTEQYLDSCGIFKDAVISILATIAKQERLRQSERVKAGMARAKASGLKVGRKPLAVRKGIDLQEVVRMHTQVKYGGLGMSFRAIGKRLKVSAPSAMRMYRAGAGVTKSPQIR